MNQAILKGMEVEAKDRLQSMPEWLKLLRGEAAPDNQAMSVGLRNRRYATINQPYPSSDYTRKVTEEGYYTSRKPAEDFLARFAKAMEQPESQPLLFHVYG